MIKTYRPPTSRVFKRLTTIILAFLVSILAIGCIPSHQNLTASKAARKSQVFKPSQGLTLRAAPSEFSHTKSITANHRPAKTINSNSSINSSPLSSSSPNLLVSPIIETNSPISAAAAGSEADSSLSSIESASAWPASDLRVLEAQQAAQQTEPAAPAQNQAAALINPSFISVSSSPSNPNQTSSPSISPSISVVESLSVEVNEYSPAQLTSNNLESSQAPLRYERAVYLTAPNAAASSLEAQGLNHSLRQVEPLKAERALESMIESSQSEREAKSNLARLTLEDLENDQRGAYQDLLSQSDQDDIYENLFEQDSLATDLIVPAECASGFNGPLQIGRVGLLLIEGRRPSLAVSRSSVNSNLQGSNLVDNAPSSQKAAKGGKKITDQLLTDAYALTGRPYRVGGRDPQHGFDDSGFVNWLYGRQGLKIPASSAEQVAKGQKVTKESLRPGDILVYKTPKSSDFLVGVYTGSGNFIFASSKRQVVTETAAFGSDYGPYFLGGRRYFDDPSAAPLSEELKTAAANGAVKSALLAMGDNIPKPINIYSSPKKRSGKEKISVSASTSKKKSASTKKNDSIKRSSADKKSEANKKRATVKKLESAKKTAAVKSKN
ncbi:MAG: C40 family peptidase [Deltaproteobacteria bacterium]|jgi:hypothetical protein|nr:C40 family peptidase [Deltaproteobacteria bacterium]